MFDNHHRLELQLFAEGAAGDGGAGGEGASPAETGVTDAAAGHQHLEALGVPQNRISKRASAVVGRAMKSNADGSTRAGEPAQQAAAAAESKEGKQTFQIPEGCSVDDIIGYPEVNKAVQDIISKRVNASKDAAAAMEAMRPAIEVLSRQYGMDPAKPDYAALAKAVEGDDRYYEDMALANGVDVDTARRMDAEDRASRRDQEAIRQQKMQETVALWRQEEAQLKAQGVHIDLSTEAQNPVFMNLLRAGFGVRGAYEAVHHAEIVAATKKAAFQEAQTRTVDAIKSGIYRPGDLGSSQAPQRKLTQADRHSIRAALERGQKVDPALYGIY